MSTEERIVINTQGEFWELVTYKDRLKVFDFQYYDFNCDIRIRDKEVYSISFMNCRFLRGFMMKTSVRGYACFIDTAFKDAYFSGSTFQDKSLLINCIFNGRSIFSKLTFNSSAVFSGSVFNNKTFFFHSIFNDEVSFTEVKFVTDLSFHSSTCYKTIDFSKSIFDDNIDFSKVSFLGKAFFTETEFKENVLFTDAIIKDDIVFRGTKFKKGLDLSLAVISGQINSFDIELKNYKSIDNDAKEIGDFDIKEKNKRETFRILKHHNIKQSNSIDYIEFARLEHAAYASELWKRIRGNRFISICLFLLKVIGFPLLLLTYLIKWLDKKLNLREFFSILSDYLIFSLNRYSNNHGTSYWRGIAFTFLVGWAFFYSSLLTTQGFDYTSFDWEVCKSYFKYYFDFMNLTHKISYLEAKSPGAWSYLWDFLGRVFISYGIYQTVQAFRKYKKG